MGNSNSAQPTDYQVESSERVTLYETTFERLGENVEHLLPDQAGIFYQFRITFSFVVNNDTELLKGVFTREQIYENVVVGQMFPVKRSSELRTGIFEECGVFNVGSFHKHSIDLYIPKNLAFRRICGFLLDSDNVVVAKARGIVAFEDEFHLNDTIETRVPIERASRAQGLHKLSQIAKQNNLRNAIAGLTDTLNNLSSFRKSRVEFLEASDSVKLAFRAYFPKSTPVAIFIIVASNSHFHDIIASGMSHANPVTAYILEMRGYGYSGGPRGFAPYKEQIWMDIRTFVRYIKMNSPGVPIFIAGQYYQGGLVLNYATWKEREPVSGYAFVSPNFGSMAAETTNQQAIAQLAAHDTRTAGQSDYSFASTFFGKTQEQRYFLSEYEHEFNPLIVDQASVTVSKACSSYSPRRQFESIDKPFSVWIGEKEEFLIPEKLIFYPRQAKVLSSINILPDLTHMGVLNHVAKHIGDWIMTLDAVKKNHLDEVNFDMIDMKKCSPDEFKHPVLRDFDLVMSSYCQLGLNYGKCSYLIANDGSQIRYQVFMPPSLKPTTNIVLIQSDIKAVLGWILANKCDAAIYTMDLRGIDNAAIIAKDSIFMDVRTVVRHLKCNDPEMPLLLGGHGYGGSVALNYSNWKFREAVNGYLFISPIVDYHSGYAADLQIADEPNMNRLFAKNETKFCRRTYSYSSGLNVLPASRRSVSSGNSNRSSQPEDQEISLSLWDNIVSRNVTSLFANIDVPFGLWVGSQDELVRGSKFVAYAKDSAAKLALKEIQLVPYASHYGNLITSTAYVVPFIRKFTKIVAPSLIFKLRNPTLDDFENLQFIGRGSFGKVYLMRHHVSEKYFAMKVLSKKDIVEANEVKHVISERNILRDLNSSFVVSFVGSFQDQHHLYLLMDYVIGGELFTQLSLKKRLSNEAANFYAAEVVLFFEDIHSRNIIYRDLKPENILIDAMGHVKITDFGFAKYLRNGKTFTFCGTPQYMAPEIIINAELGSRAKGYTMAVDYYALGVLIYEMLVGQTPFHDTNIRSIYRRVLYGNIEFPWGMDASAKEIIRSLLIRSPMKRLGCIPGQSLDDIKRHKWFRGIDWEQLRRREIPPPFVPKFSHAGDTSNFIPWGRDKQKVYNPDEDYGNTFVDF